MSVTEAARGFSDLINRVRYRGESATLFKGGRPVAVVAPVRPACTGADLAGAWDSIHHLGEPEAARFERDIRIARKKLKKPVSRWD